MREMIRKAIEEADDLELSEIMQAIIRRENHIFPENEAFFLSLPKNDREERRRVLDGMTRCLLEEKQNGPRKGNLGK